MCVKIYADHRKNNEILSYIYKLKQEATAMKMNLIKNPLYLSLSQIQRFPLMYSNTSNVYNKQTHIPDGFKYPPSHWLLQSFLSMLQSIEQWILFFIIKFFFKTDQHLK